MQCIAGADRTWANPYVKQATKSKFRGLLKKGEKGSLRMEDDLKPIRLDPELFELRWQDVQVQERNAASGELRLLGVSVRMYFYEGEESGKFWFKGLHVHEKQILESQKETDDAQDAEIKKAVANRDACEDGHL